MSDAPAQPSDALVSSTWLAGLGASCESVVAIERHAGLTVIVLDLRDDCAGAITTWLVEAGTELFTAIREILDGGGSEAQRICVLVVDPATRDAMRPARAAACAMVRGAILSLALERPESRLTMVRARPVQLAQLAPTLTFLASDDASYVTAATLDVAART